MTRRNRVARLEAAQAHGEQIGPDNVIGFYLPDLDAGAFVDAQGRTLPMTDDQRAEAEAARAYLAQPEDEDDEDPPRVTFRLQIAPLPRAPKRPR